VKKIRVMIVEDSDVVREFLQHIISRDPRLEVAAAVGTAEAALRILRRVSPDVISMDIRLPGMNGFEATTRIMTEKPTPIVVVSASVESADLKITMNALRAGALTVLEKPVGTTHEDYSALAERLCTQLAIMSEVKVVSQRGFRPSVKRPVAPCIPPQSSGVVEIMGVVASTGGPNALVQLFNGLGKEFLLPILLVQHITASFLEGFVSWLASVCPFPVRIIRNGQAPTAGAIHVAPPDYHLRIARGKLWADHSDPVCAQRPSGTVLFQSMASELGPQALGVLLTGMGNDGADGLLAIREAGGYTIAEDESTAVVYGMPAAAVELGAACESLALPAIPARVAELLAVEQEAS
jgi:two-component system, chemotaxis family, protein-glutamate methylesterase/glutaminase